MQFIESIVLGVVQGLTEFLPISSSAHLILVPLLTGWEYFGKDFDTALHLGTFFGVLIYYRTEVLRLLKGFFASFGRIREIPVNMEYKMPWMLILATLPAGIVGLALEDVIESKFGAVPSIATLLIVFGILLGFAETAGKGQRETESLGWKEMLYIGIAQALALFPGVSRSGITMTAGLFLGLKKESAANVSFLMSIPVVGGAALYSFVKLLRNPSEVASWGVFLVGILAAAVSGYAVIRFLLNYLKKGSFAPFMYYRLALGVLLLGLYFFQVLK